jgi:hypothetical protein
LSAAGGSATINAGVTTLGGGAIGLTTTGAGNPIAVNAAVATGTGAIAAAAGGAITQTGGRFAGGSLTATSAGGQDLDGANAVTAITATNTGGDVLFNNAATTLTVHRVTQTAGGNTTVTNAGAVAVVGGVNGSGVGLTASGGGMTISAGVTADAAAVGLTTTGAGNAIAVNAAVTAVTSATATAGGAITQTGGLFRAPSLTATSAGGQNLVGANAVSIFSAANAGSGGLTLINTLPLTLAGVRQQAASQPLTVSNGSAVNVAGVVGAANGPITITTAGDFTADVTDPATAGRVPDVSTPLLDAGTGAVLVVPQTTAGARVKLNAEVRGASAQFGQPTGVNANVGANLFDISPSRHVDIRVFGNNPPNAPGDSIIPNNDVAPVRTILLKDLAVGGPTGQSLSGRYEVTFTDGTVRNLVFSEIESFAQLGFRAAVVQTGATDYSVRATVFQGDQPVNASIDGQGLRANPFVVSPSLISPTAQFSAPAVAFGDVNGDGNADMILANGANDAPLVTVIDGVSLARGQVRLDRITLETGLIAQFYAYDPTFRGGLSVAAADFNRDGWAEIVTGPGDGGGAQIRMFELYRDYAARGLGDRMNIFPAGVPQVSIGGVALGSMSNFLPFDPNFRGGVNVAVGDIDHDGRPDLIIGAGVGGGPRVMVLSGTTGTVIQNFFAYGDQLRGGVLVAGGDFDGDGRDDILVGPGYGGAPHIKVYGFAAGQPELLVSFFAFDFDPAHRELGGLQVSDPDATSGVGSVAFGVPDGTGRQEILVGTARGPRLQLRRYNVSPTSGQTNPNLYDVLTVGSAETPGAFAILDPLTGRPLGEQEMSDGGMVGGIATD